MTELRIGTCSWKYDSWQDLVYSDRPELNYLKEYAEKYDTVEVDQWFWSLHGHDRVTLPHLDDVERYKASVPEHFTFSIKVPNSVTLTHYYKKSKSNPLISNPHFLSLDLFDQFLDTIAPLKDHLGPLIFQFEYLNKQKMALQEHFEERFATFVSGLPSNCAYAVEIRNPNYLNASYFKLLNEHGIQHVFLQGYFMPPIFDVYKKHRDAIEGSTIIRLHGPDRKGIEQETKKVWNRIVAPKDEDLDRLTEMMGDLMGRGVNIYLNVNNHFEGSAPLTIERIRDRMDR
jgi:uncharacterized protein YecE (DUF72 family)